MRNSFIVVDKPAGWTSHDVVAKMRGVFKTRRIGHGGTLDPMATGVLILGINRATKLLSYVAGTEKEYLATIRFGSATSTDDAEGEVTESISAKHLDRETIEAAIVKYRGTFDQVPSSISAVKIKGQTAYKRVRAGEEVEIAARSITVHEFDLLDIRPVAESVDVDVRVVCSSGTYIRALARDLGRDLGVGGHLTALRRTRVGQFEIDQAQSIADVEKEPREISLADMGAKLFPVIFVTEQTARAVQNGQRLDLGNLTGLTAVFDEPGRLLAVYEPMNELAQPVVVFAGD